MQFSLLLAGLLPLLKVASALPSCNNECNRACWTNGFNIYTDWETRWPITGKTRIVCFITTRVLSSSNH